MKRPNVILMLVDDLGYGDISLLNENSKIRTPNIDSLAERGVTFTDGHSTSALCTPSRYALLTGRYNWRSRLKQSVLPGGSDPLIERGRMTMAHLFRRNGYFTAAVGKWHLGLEWKRHELTGKEWGMEETVRNAGAITNPVARSFASDALDIDFEERIAFGPNQYGFDYFFGTAASLDQPPYCYIENDHVLDVPDHISGIPNLDRKTPSQNTLWQRGPASADYDHRRVIPDMQKKVLDLIEQHSEEPFFIYYPTHAVHGPLLPPPDFDGRSGLNAYADMVLYTDYMVGEITRKLKEKNIWDNTIFMFLSDNGCSGVADFSFLLGNGHNPSYHFRGKKADIWEGGHRVPAIFSWPGRFDKPIVYGETVSHADWMRTFADLLCDKLPDNAGEDSFSLMSVLDGEDRSVRKSIVFSSGDGSFSIRRGKWKLELCSGSGAGGLGNPEKDDGSYQLYDLTSDIGERNNCIAFHSDTAEKMKAELIEIIRSGRSTPGPEMENYPVERWPQLEKILKG